MGWEIFQRAAGQYERWYATDHGQRADSAEGRLLQWLLRHLPQAQSVLEVGSGTGHFCGKLAEAGCVVVGAERAPAMIEEARRRFPAIPFVLGDAHRLPFRSASVDAVVFITTLEFLDNPAAALREAVRVARRGIITIVLNRPSLGGLSRRLGPQSRGSLLREARDYSVRQLRREMRDAAGERGVTLDWSSTLFPDGLGTCLTRVPLGDVIGMTLQLK